MPTPTPQGELIERRLSRFIEGENPRTIYKLPPSGRFDPLREDVAAVLAALQSSEAQTKSLQARIEDADAYIEEINRARADDELAERVRKIALASTFIDVRADLIALIERGERDRADAIAVTELLAKAKTASEAQTKGLIEALEKVTKLLDAANRATDRPNSYVAHAVADALSAISKGLEYKDNSSQSQPSTDAGPSPRSPDTQHYNGKGNP